MLILTSEKENDVQQETERIRRQIKTEKQIQQELHQEISNLKSQLEETRQGLQAATRLGDQLEYTKKQNVALKEEGKSIFALIFCLSLTGMLRVFLLTINNYNRAAHEISACNSGCLFGISEGRLILTCSVYGVHQSTIIFFTFCRYYSEFGFACII